MDFNTIIPFILPIISVLALIISIFSISYTYYQNKRKIEVNLWIDEGNPPIVKLCAFNSGYRSVALINCKLIVNNKPFDIIEGHHDVDRTKYDGASGYWVEVDKKIDFPHVLKEGHAVLFSINTRQFAGILYYNDFTEVIKLSGCYKTAQKKIYMSKSTIDFDIEKYRIK